MNFQGNFRRAGLRCVALVAVCAVSAAHAELPAMKFMTAPLVSPTTAVSTYGVSSHTSSVPGFTRAGEIKELARGLGSGQATNDVYAQRVHEYIYNNIRVSFMFGLQKGALGALIDQAGTPFDQAHLMVELLGEAGIQASYEVGVITLNGTQANQWFGMTNAVATCRLLADGGIPATVNGSSSATCSLSGSVSSVTMLHVWVSALGKRYDPAFKVHTIKNAISLATPIQCGTTSGCTGSLDGIRSQATSAATSGADQSVPTGAAAAIRSVNQTGLESQLRTWSMNLKAKLDASYFDKETADILGGHLIDAAAMPAPGSALPYGSPVAQATWTEIPDRYRTKLRVQYDFIDRTLFVDEIAGRRLRFYFTAWVATDTATFHRQTGLFLDWQSLGSSYREDASLANDSLQLSVDHPYLANGQTYLDETVIAGMGLVPLLSWTIPSDYNGPELHSTWHAEIVHGWGHVGSGAPAHVAMVQKKDTMRVQLAGVSPGDASVICRSNLYTAFGRSPAFDTIDPGCLHPERAVQAAQWLAESSRVADLVAGVNNSIVTHHHSLGTVVWNGAMNVESSVSTISKSSSAGDRRSTNYSYAALSARLEGGIAEQLSGTWEGGSVPSVIARANEKGLRFARYESAANYAAANHPGSITPPIRSALESYLNNGYTITVPDAAIPGFTFNVRKFDPGAPNYPANVYNVYLTNPFVAVKGSAADATIPDRIAHLSSYGWAGDGLFKGASSNLPGSDPVKTAMETTKLQDVSLKARKYLSSDLNSGAMKFTPPADLVTGSGSQALSFQRFYDSRSDALPNSLYSKDVNDRVCLDNPAFYGCDYYAQLGYSTSSSAIGRGWEHSWNISASINSDAFQGLGEDSPVDAVGAITSVFALRALTNTAPGFPEMMASAFVANWFGRNLVDNAVIVKRPPSSAVFVRLPDGSFNAPPNSPETLTQSGVLVGPFGKQPDRTSPEVPVVFDYAQVTFSLVDKLGSRLDFNFGQSDPHPGDTLGSRYFKAAAWTFPTGLAISFGYTGGSLPHCLTSVSNNFGRSFSFTNEPIVYTSTRYGVVNRQPVDQCYIKQVTDETGRLVQFRRPGAISAVGRTGSEAYFGGLYRMPELQVEMPDGAVTRYLYTENFTDPAALRFGAPITVVHTPSDHVSPFMRAEYDSLFRVSALIDALNQRSEYFIGGIDYENLRRSDSRQPDGAWHTAYFGKFGQQLQIIDPLNRVTSKSYDGRQRITRTIHPEGNSTQWVYDKRHNVTYVHQNAKGGTSQPLTRRSIYPTTCTNPVTCNLPTSTRDYLGASTSFSWDPTTGLLTRVTRPTVGGVAPFTQHCYAPQGPAGAQVSTLIGSVERVLSSTYRVTRYTYDPARAYTLDTVVVDPANSLSSACAATTKANALALTTNYDFDAVGDVHAIDGPRIDVADVTTFERDPMRRLQSISGVLGQQTIYKYDADGLLEWTDRAETENGVTTWRRESRQYWPTGDLRMVQDAEGNQTHYTYDAAGRVDVITDPDGRKKKHEYYADGQLHRVWHAWQSPNMPAIRYSEYVYTPNGKLDLLRDARDNVTDYFYDGHDRLIRTLFADGSDELLTYTVDGTATGALCGGEAQLCRKTMRDDRTITFTYDAVNRMSTKAPQDLPVVTYGYNLRDEATSLSSPALASIPAHSIAYDYDAAGRRRYEENDGRRVSYTFDRAGNRERTTWPDGYFVTYEYDALNRMQYVRENGSVELAYYEYDTLSRRKSVRFAGQATNRIAYSYETDGDLDAMTNYMASATVTLDYRRNLTGQIRGVTASDGFYLPEPTESSATYVPNVLNQYSAVGGQSIAYDTNGNLTSWAATGGRHTYTYDVENRLRTAAVDGSATPSIVYDYDPLGRRVSKTVGTTVTRYLLDGDEEIAELDASGAVLRRYVTGPGVDDRIAAVEGPNLTNPAKTYFHVNHQGSVVAVTDAAGTITQRLAYDEYGLLATGAVPTGVQYRYTGRRFDPETGLYYYRARYYSPELGRFLQTDPVGYKDDYNLYAYVGNDPANNKDPTGAIVETVWDIANVAMDVASLGTNLASGNFVGAAVDAAGLIVDAAATVIPGVPGGAGAAIKAARGGAKLVEQGASGVKTATKYLEGKGMTKAGDEITVATANGKTKVDTVMKDGNKNVGVEVKDGDTAKLNRNQRSQHAEVNAGGDNAMRGGNAKKAGLEGQAVDHIVTVHTKDGEVVRAYCQLDSKRGC